MQNDSEEQVYGRENRENNGNANPYSQSGSTQGNPYSQGNPYVQGAAYGQNPPYQQGNAYAQTNPYQQGSAYGQGNPYENNAYRQNGQPNPNDQPRQETNGQNGTYSDIHYTYTPGGNGPAYNAGTGTQKKKKAGSGCFVALIAGLLCITVVAAGISLYSIFSGKNENKGQAENPTSVPSATLTPLATNPGSAIDSVVQVRPTPTPKLIDGQILTPQQAADKVLPSVVCIQCYVTSSRYGANTSSLYSEGSGIVSSKDGYIITNAHVISDASFVQVVFFDGSIHEAEIIGYDTVTDIALLKVDPKDVALTPASFTSAANCHVADTVLAIGNPGGLEFSSSVTQGIISALNRAMQDNETGYIMHCIQTDTAINPGNSGGPLIDLYGNVIGITSSKIVADGYENMGFAITYDEAAPILQDLLAYGRVKNRASINITLALPSNVFRMSGWGSIPSGLCITEVLGDAEKAAGLNNYDIISAIDGTRITSMADYSAYLLTKKPGDTVELTIYRAKISGWSVQYANEPITISLKLSEAN